MSRKIELQPESKLIPERPSLIVEGPSSNFKTESSDLTLSQLQGDQIELKNDKMRRKFDVKLESYMKKKNVSLKANQRIFLD